MHVAVLRIYPCVTTPRLFTSLPTGGKIKIFGFCSNKQTNEQQTNKQTNIRLLTNKPNWYDVVMRFESIFKKCFLFNGDAEGCEAD